MHQQNCAEFEFSHANKETQETQVCAIQCSDREPTIVNSFSEIKKLVVLEKEFPTTKGERVCVNLSPHPYPRISISNVVDKRVLLGS